MEIVIFEDFLGVSTEVSTSIYYDGVVSLTETDSDGDSFAIAHYTPEQARKLAEALIKVAEEAEKQ